MLMSKCSLSINRSFENINSVQPVLLNALFMTCNHDVNIGERLV